jgi:hypothetical protein
MPVVTTETYSVRSEDVFAVVKTVDEPSELYWVTASLRNGETVNFRFADVDGCEKFYKTLVDAMGQ